MDEISTEHSKEILNKMCEWINIDPKTVDWTDREWFTQHTWTAEQEQKFIDWVAGFLLEKKYVRGPISRTNKKTAHHQATKIVANYGWKTQSE